MNPPLTPERWRLIEPLIDAALDVPPDRRRAIIAERAAGDHALRDEALALLAKWTDSGALPMLGRPAPEVFAALLADELDHAFERLSAALADRYRLERPVGRGGMATVYLAEDRKHQRRVAIKVLHRELATLIGSGRFLTEIRTTANLQHPHILPLFDSGEAAGFLYYVMPFVEGETLRDRLEREGQLPVEDAVRIGVAVASALDYAHRQGVVHRDLKPDNILLHDGQPLVTDFGIALAVTAAGGARITQSGFSLGTPQYMSPEQATGDRHIDARSDIYALGTVIYELLAGEPPHTGNTSQAIVAKVLTEQPRRLRALRPTVPKHVETTVLRALAKLPADRFSTAVEFSEALSGVRVVARAGFQEPAAAVAGEGTIVRRRPSFSALAGWASTLVVIFFAILVWPSPQPASPIRLFIPLPVGERVETSTTGGGRQVAVSSDGRVIFQAGTGPTETRLYVRALDQLVATPIPGLQVPHSPFLSPDERWVGYFDGGYNISKVPVEGGPAVRIVSATSSALPRGASWGPDDHIIYATSDRTTGLLRVPAGGGVLQVLTTPDTLSGEGDHIHPQVLPGGRAVLFQITRPGEGNPQLAVLDLNTRRYKVVFSAPEISHPLYATSGHIVYQSSGALNAVAFDLARLEVEGDPAIIVDGLSENHFAVSRTGMLVYVAGRQQNASRTLVWVDRRGREEPLAAPPLPYFYPRLSPDNTQLALDVRDRDAAGNLTAGAGRGSDIYIWDISQQNLRRLTLDPEGDLHPVWMPDGERIVFTSVRGGGPQNIYMQAADGSGAVARLTESPRGQLAYAVTPDSKSLIFRQNNPNTIQDVHIMALDGERSEHPLVQTPYDERNADISPNGRWMAYQSNVSERNEVYVTSLPNTESGHWQISTEGGSAPVWARDGRELFYLSPDGRLMSVAVQTNGSAFVYGSPQRVLENAYANPTVPGRHYDVANDGRFLMMKEASAEQVPYGLVVNLNWFEELTRLAPAARN